MMHSFCEMVQIIISYVGLFIYGIDAKSTFNYSLHIRQNLIMYMVFFPRFRIGSTRRLRVFDHRWLQGFTIFVNLLGVDAD
jgi:hypothetical protein